MATMTLQMPDGSSRSITVDDRLRDMTPEDQGKFADEARQQILQSQQQNAPAASQAPAAAPADNPNDSYANDLQSGAAGLEHGARATARLADQLPDWVPGKQTVSGFGHGQQAIQQPQGYTPAPSRLTDAIRNRDWSAIPGLLAHAGVQSVPGMIPGIAAGAVGGPLAAAGVITAQNAGENVEARQAANGNAQPSTGDLIGGGLTSLAQGAIGAGGLSAASRGLVRGVAGEAAAGATNDAVGQVGQSAGTQQGVHLDPAEVAAAGLQQGAARGVTLAPGVARAGVKAGVDEAMARSLPPPVSDDHAQAIKDVKTLYDQALQNAADAKGDTRPTQVMNNVKRELANNATETTRALAEVGIIAPEHARTLMGVWSEAERHNNTISESGGEGPATLFDRIKDVPVDPDTQAQLQRYARALDSASDQSFLKNQTGPLQMLGSAAGRLGALGGAVASGDPHAMIGAVLGSPITAKVGGAIGRIGDNVLDTATPTLLLKAKLAQRMLDGAGKGDDGTNVIERMQALRQRARDQGDANSTLDAQAQTRADAASRANALALLTAQKVPQDVGPDPVAAQAAHAAAIAKARALIGQANSEPGLADRLAVGLPADVIPPNTPIAPNGVPNVQGPAGPQRPALGAAPVPVSVAPPLVPHPAPSSPPAPPVRPAEPSSLDGPPVHPWERYVAHTSDATRADVHQALEDMAAVGIMPAARVAELRSSTGGIDPAEARPVQQHLAVNMGKSFRGSPKGSPPDGYRGPIHDPEKWREARDVYQTHASDKLALADTPDLKAAILNIRDEPTRAGKEKLAADYLATVASARDAKHRALALQLLTGPLLNSKVP